MSNDEERVTEADLMIPALKIMAEQPDGFVSTTDLIRRLEMQFQPKGKDADVIEGRADTYFSQKVRNLASHRGGSTSLVVKGWADYDDTKKGWWIRDEGRAIIESS